MTTCRHCGSPIMPAPYGPDIWVHARNGLPFTTHCTAPGHSDITQAEPPDDYDEEEDA